MDLSIIFRIDRLRKLCNKPGEAVRRLGPRCAEILKRRLDDLRAADSLADFRSLPGDCHEYKYENEDVLTLDLEGGKRLMFGVADDPIPRLADGVSLDWGRVTAVEIILIGDPHGKRKK
jgi:plasmid maintenance system killer protein